MIADGAARTPRPVILAVLNASPESFSGNVAAAADAADLAVRLVEDGADVLDVGAQSLRTDQVELPVQHEIDRLRPVLEAVRDRLPDQALSVDTYRHQVAVAALDYGITIINDPSGLDDDAMSEVVASSDLSIVVTHNPGPPKVRRPVDERLADPVEACRVFLSDRIERLTGRGVGLERIIVDPGPDLYKPPDQTIEVLRAMGRLRSDLGITRVLWAVSRKDFVGALTTALPRDRGAGTLGALAALPVEDCDLVRVHDVRATVDFFDVQRAVTRGVPESLELPEGLRYDR